MKKIYNKLVRDRIPEIIAENGSQCRYHVASPEELKQALLNKLREEVEEFIEEPYVEELADIQEVLWRIQEVFNITEYEVRDATRQKAKERGIFDEGYILEYVLDELL